MILQCKNCNRWYKGKYKLRRHYLTYLPFYFGSYICSKCGISFETELKLLNHLIKKKHSDDQKTKFNVQLKREQYFEKEENKYFGSRNIRFDEADITYFLKHKGVSDIDVKPLLNKLLNIEEVDVKKTEIMEFNSKPVSSTFYDAITPGMSLPTPFEENVIKAEPYFPQPPGKRVSTSKTATVTRPTKDPSLDILDQRIQNLELKVENLEQSIKSDIQCSKEEILSKIEQNMDYERQLFQALTNQLRDIMVDIFAKAMQGAFSAISLQSNPTGGRQ